MTDGDLATLYKEYLKLTSKNCQAAAILALAHVGCCLLDELRTEKTADVSLDFNATLNTPETARDFANQLRGTIWSAQNPEQGEQYEEMQKELKDKAIVDGYAKMQQKAKEVWG